MAAGEDPLGEGVPRWVEDDFRAYLRCGILTHGFARVRCGACAAERLVAFSCKGRGVCPSCNARRMVEVAAQLTDQSCRPSRSASGCARCRSGSDLSCPTTRASPATCSGSSCAPSAPRSGAPVPAPIPTHSSAPSPSCTVSAPHSTRTSTFHVVVLDGVFSEEPDGSITLHEATHLSADDVHRLQRTLQRRVLRLFQRRGLIDDPTVADMLTWQAPPAQPGRLGPYPRLRFRRARAAHPPLRANVRTGESAIMADVVQVSANIFELLGARAARGRLQMPSDDEPDAPRVAVLSHGYWERELGRDPRVVGTTLEWEGSPIDIVCILDREFQLPDQPADVYIARRIAVAGPHYNWHHLIAVGVSRRALQILHELAWRRRGDLIARDDGGVPRVLVPQPRLEDAVANAFDQIRHFAAGNPGVAIAMTRLLGRLAAMTPARARPVFAEHLEETVLSARALIVDAVDRQRYNEAVVEAQRLAAGEAVVDG